VLLRLRSKQCAATPDSQGGSIEARLLLGPNSIDLGDAAAREEDELCPAPAGRYCYAIEDQQ